MPMFCISIASRQTMMCLHTNVPYLLSIKSWCVFAQCSLCDLSSRDNVFTPKFFIYLSSHDINIYIHTFSTGLEIIVMVCWTLKQSVNQNHGPFSDEHCPVTVCGAAVSNSKAKRRIRKCGLFPPSQYVKFSLRRPRWELRGIHSTRRTCLSGHLPGVTDNHRYKQHTPSLASTPPRVHDPAGLALRPSLTWFSPWSSSAGR